MAKVSIYHDLRAVKDGQPGPLKIKVFHNGKAFMLSTPIKLLPEQWLGNQIVNHPQTKSLKNLLTIKLAGVNSKIMELDVLGKLPKMTAEQLKAHLNGTDAGHQQEPESGLFLPVFNEYVQAMKNSGTISIWNNTLNRITSYCNSKGINIDELTFEEITPDWLRSFDAFMSLTAPKRNARNINHRNLRTLFNYARKRCKMNIQYPFEEFKIIAEETPFLALDIEQVRQLCRIEIEESHIEKCRDIFMLMVYLRGINAADLFGAMRSQVVNGRLRYYRRKTGALVSVKIEPEASHIIRKYAGKDYLIDIAENWSDPKDYLRKMDKYLKRIGTLSRTGRGGKKQYDSLFPWLTSNAARHTWATLVANELGYSIDVASEGLSHKYGSRTTQIYIMKMQKNVDRANREVIDYILNREDVV